MSISELRDLGEAHALLGCVLGMGDGRERSLMQPQTQRLGIDAQQGTNVRPGKKIHEVGAPFRKADRLRGPERHTGAFPRFLGNCRVVAGQRGQEKRQASRP